jgi:hypothetical protein
MSLRLLLFLFHLKIPTLQLRHVYDTLSNHIDEDQPTHLVMTIRIVLLHNDMTLCELVEYPYFYTPEPEKVITPSEAAAESRPPYATGYHCLSLTPHSETDRP